MTAARRVVAALVGALTLLALSICPAAGRAHDEESLQGLVTRWASEIGAPGMAARIVDSGGARSAALVGVDGDGHDIDGSTPFVWGSVSKQFAAATARGLECEGVLDATSPVVEVVPQARRVLSDPAVTVDDLVHHTSGLPQDITVTDEWTRRGSATDAVTALDAPKGAGPRGEFRYSSLNYLLLQAVIEQAGGSSYADAVRRLVLDPAGSDAITDPQLFVDSVPRGHVPFFGSSRPVDVGVDSAGLGYGYLAGSIDDLGRYASWRLREGHDGEARNREVPTGQGSTTYGDGLFHERIDGHDVWWHAGAVPGYYTYVSLIPSLDTAIVVAANRYGEIEADRLAAVGRNLTTSVTGGRTSELPESSASTVLGALAAIIAALVVGMGVHAVSIVSGRMSPRTRRVAVVRGVVALAVGTAAVIAVLFGMSASTGAGLAVAGRWAPDVTLLVWMLLGAIVVAAVVVVLGQVVGCRRVRGA
ncbi:MULTISPECIES: serine hydrolase [Nocardiaceae]|uniref:CubicO group peptidase (Beta-lactamase class C family) n=1 Tax=Rhodococcoides corynebacterioides TaxID=53972 RepID=A0ABS2KU81_9NOCA|nr:MULTISPECIES: serine hydrolase domain-containing protein [Rhodococcus]MBM7415504.1 CubicO group peptidase (beta-lactamase class C family) [Rhodococcus corynebacterioides]MBP1117966.1 CubicO group peptidase (beta-lactamase class C family) [Rhodococcus sp. PvP016]